MPITVSIFSIIIASAIILGLFIFVLVVTTRKKNHTADGVLAVFLLTVIFALSNALITETNAYRQIPCLLRACEPFRFLIAPFFYFYAGALSTGKFRWEKRLLLHFIPFAVNAAILVPFYMEPSQEKIQFVNNNRLEPQLSYSIYRLTTYIAMLIQFVCYVYYAKKDLRLYETTAKEQFSSIEKISLSWLDTTGNILITFCSFLSINCFYLFFAFLNGPLSGRMTISPSLFPGIGSVLVIIFVFKALRQPHILNTFQLSEIDGKPGKKYELSTLSNKKTEEYAYLLGKYMEHEKPYLKPALTLQDISDSLDIPLRHLSQVLNENIGKNFYTYINTYRIEEIKNKLSDPKLENETILQLAYSAGFNSKATFNEVFKRMTGTTPLHFRRQSKKQT